MAKRHYLPVTADVPGVNDGLRAFMRKVIRTALEGAGYRCVWAPDGADAADKLDAALNF